MRYRIAIVGARISGLAASYCLHRSGFKPVVFEANSFVGGRMNAENANGFLIDTTAYKLPESSQHFRDFIR